MLEITDLLYILTTSRPNKRKRLRWATAPGWSPLGEKRTNDVITFRFGGNLLLLFKKR